MNLGRGELPEAFEAEERSVPGLGDLLHIVSGRTLLGAVRERRTDRLDDSGRAMQAYLQAVSQQKLEGVRPGEPASRDRSGRAREDHLEQECIESCVQGGSDVEHGSRGQAAGQMHGSGSTAEDAGTDVRWQGQGEESSRPAPQILELTIQDELVAIAVRQREFKAHSMRSSNYAEGTGGRTGDMQPQPGWMQDSSAAGGTQRRQSRPAGAAGKGQDGAESRARAEASSSGQDAAAVISMYTPEGRLLCELVDRELRGGCLDGRVNFSVIRVATPLVRHLYIVAETGTEHDLLFSPDAFTFMRYLCKHAEPQL